MRPDFYPNLEKYIQSLEFSVDHQDLKREKLLQSLASFIRYKLANKQKVNLLFVCTHNSRRSHFGQIWAAIAARHFGLNEQIVTFSGGTEVTSFNPRAVAALERIGFEIRSVTAENPRYELYFTKTDQPLICYSKKFDDPSIPIENLVAIMTCAEADQDCPYIPGAELRVPLHYEDPKIADGTSAEEARYDERCRQIASEMFYVMRMVQTIASEAV